MWLKEVVNSTFYSQFYTFNMHYPYIRNHSDTSSKGRMRYFSALETLDESLKFIFQTLNATDYLENTIIVLSGDHGESAEGENILTGYRSC
jgi:arylsulfatase A-like enzyme